MKGFKPHFNINIPNKNQQDQFVKDDSKREDSFWKRGYHQPNVGDAKKIMCERISFIEERE
jgi:hypothetical protein